MHNLQLINNQTPDAATANAQDLNQDIAWCEQLINHRINHYFEQDKDTHSQATPPEPAILDSNNSSYANFIHQHQLDEWDRLLLVLALIPHIKPQAFEVFLTTNSETNQPFRVFGCQQINQHLYASGETLAFIIAGNDLTKRFAIQKRFHPRSNNAILSLLEPYEQSSVFNIQSPLILSPQYIALFTTEQSYQLEASSQFPASPLTTNIQWDDLILSEQTKGQLTEIQTYLQHHQTLLNDWGMADKLRPGYRALFYGPPGTGKTLAAKLLGNLTNKTVYRVDLSQVLSKYIGETEKNLALLFNQAQKHQWILFFDEADALFGKRIQTSSSNDQFANQNVAYLLQRIETFDGITVLATNIKENFDEAFFRRFESIVHFTLPNAQQRLTLWQKNFSHQSTLAPDVNLTVIADQYALSAADIINVIRFASIKALSNNSNIIENNYLIEGINRQMGQVDIPRW